MFDDLDYKILECLSLSARMSFTELAQTLSLSVPSTAERVRKLEEKGVIKGYTTSVNYKLLGLDLTAFVFVTLAHPKHRAAFLAEVQKYPEIQECHHITGDDDYLLKVRCFNSEHLDVLLNDRLKQLPGILKTRTTIALSSPKEISRVIRHDS